MAGPKKVVFENRTEYRLDGEYHREDGPAVIRKDGYRAWYLNGELHREDGPAIIWGGGTEMWYLHGKLHREDGPAIIWDDGTEEWFITGIELTEEDIKIAIKILSGEYPFKQLPLLVNHPTLKYFAKMKLGDHKI